MWNLHVTYQVHKNPPTVPVLRQMTLVHILICCFSVTKPIYFNTVCLFIV